MVVDNDVDVDATGAIVVERAMTVVLVRVVMLIKGQGTAQVAKVAAGGVVVVVVWDKEGQVYLNTSRTKAGEADRQIKASHAKVNRLEERTAAGRRSVAKIAENDILLGGYLSQSRKFRPQSRPSSRTTAVSGDSARTRRNSTCKPSIRDGKRWKHKRK